MGKEKALLWNWVTLQLFENKSVECSLVRHSKRTVKSRSVLSTSAKLQPAGQWRPRPQWLWMWETGRTEGPTSGCNDVGGLLKSHVADMWNVCVNLVLSYRDDLLRVVLAEEDTHLCVLSSGQKVMSVSDVLKWPASVCTRPSCRGADRSAAVLLLMWWRWIEAVMLTPSPLLCAPVFRLVSGEEEKKLGC